MINKKQLINKLKHAKLLCLDMDGTLTDGGMYIDENGVSFKRFYAHDGTGLQMVKHIGIEVALITTSVSSIVTKRADILQIKHVISGSHKKGIDIINLTKKLNINLEHTIHIGDDVNDIPAFKEVGIPIAVNNAADAILPFCIYQTQNKGGKGAIREVCDAILLAQKGSLYGPPYVDTIIQ